MSDMTIAALRTTLLRVPWPDDPWLKGHRFGEARNLLLRRHVPAVLADLA